MSISNWCNINLGIESSLLKMLGSINQSSVFASVHESMHVFCLCLAVGIFYVCSEMPECINSFPQQS